ncbi:MAG: tRNA dihydrouridine synthase DusB [Thiotrichaceae bacterium]|nr:tRNA dihydrouridine synthase DusB [Thiotrichaceae bacterium]
MLTIGPYTLKSNILLAPMAGITDPPFRTICREFGAGLTTSEMLTSDIDLWDSPKSKARLPQANEAEPRSVQIAGTDPHAMARAAEFCVDKGAQIIDINMGCPVKKVCNAAAGSALMQDKIKVRAILKALTSKLTVPVTLKIRTGWSRKNRNAIEIAQIAEQEGITAISIHGRSREDGFKGFAEYETIRQLKHLIQIPIIANGDITTIEDIRFILNYTDVDGIMIGRVARGRPWIFKELNQSLESGLAIVPTPRKLQHSTIYQHVLSLHQFFSTQGLQIARKHIGWYLDSLGVSKQNKLFIFGATTPAQQLEYLHEVLDAS